MGVTIDGELWGMVRAAVKRAARAVGRRGRRRPVYSDALVASMYLWCVWHDRPLCWACDRGHYTTLFRPRGPLPSVSQFARRVRTEAVRLILARVHDDLAGAAAASPVTILDGKPLPVGPPSRDPDAARGRVSGGFAKGYKLHAAVTADGRIPAWAVRPLNVAEVAVAAGLVARLAPPAGPGALVLADSAYDAAPLHRQVAATGRRLHCPLRGQGQLVGGAHHPVTLRQMGPARRAAVAYWRDRPAQAARELGPRARVETTFAALTACGGGLTCLPAWVRTLPRVTRWVGGKIIFYHARLTARKSAAA